MPMVSQAQRAWMHIHHPEMADRWEAHTPKGKKLPKHVKHKKTKDKKAFFEAFLSAARRDGLSIDETVKRAHEAVVELKLIMAKSAMTTPDPVPSGSTVGALGNIATNGFLLGTVGLPAALGTIAGAGLGHMRNNSDTVEIPTLRQLALARAYKRRAEELKANQNAAAMTRKHPGEYIQLG